MLNKTNPDRSKQTIKIFCIYHSKSTIFRSDAVEPIQSGTALSSEDLGFLKDNTGDNISLKNFFYGELTVNYWVWKNYLPAVPKIQYIGFCHYRRFLDFKKAPTKKYPPFDIIKFFKQFSINFKNRYSQKKILRYIRDYDIILPKLLKMKLTVYEQYIKFHPKSSIDDLITVIKEHFPQYEDSLNETLNGKNGYFCLNFVMKTHLFDDWMSFLFNVIEKLEKISDWNALTDINEMKQNRFAAFLAERLFNIWLNFKIKHENLKILERKSYILTEPSAMGIRQQIKQTISGL